MSDQTPRTLATVGRLCRRARDAVTAVLARARHRIRCARTLDDQHGATTPAQIHSTGDRTMTRHASDHEPRPDATSVRHLRIGNDEWRAAATRARREGWGLAAVVRELVRAYGAGELNPTRRNSAGTPDRGGAPTRPGASGSEQTFDSRADEPVSGVAPTHPTTTTDPFAAPPRPGRRP